MKPLCAEQIRGNWATLIVPWNSDDALDLSRLAAEIDTLIAMQVDGIYSHGTAGEFHCQTEDEFDQVSGLLAEKCNAAGMPFQIGVSHMSPQISLGRLQRTVSLEPSAVQVIVPDWFPPTNQEIVTFLQRMAETAGPIGLVLYHPPHAKRSLAPAEIGSFAAEVPSLIGLKTAGGDAAWFAEMRAHLSSLSVFVPGHLLASGFQQGAHGAYSNVACLNPAAAQRWSDQMRTDLPAALEVEQRLRAFMAEHIAPLITRDKFCNAACDRLLGLIGGWAEVGETMRWPYRSIPVSEAQRLRPIAKAMLPEFFSVESS